MTKAFTPRAYQLTMMDHIIDNPKCAVWLPMGMGKTSATLMALDMLSLVLRDIYPALILAPLRVARDTWPMEVEKWQEFSHLKVQPIIGSGDVRLKALLMTADIYTINYENLPWLVEQLGSKWPFKTVVVDESTKLKSYRTRQGGARAAALAKMLPYISRIIELSGTPAPNGLADLWGQIFFLDNGARLGKSFNAFEQRWFKRSFDGYGIIQLPHAEKEIHERIKDLCLSLDPRDYFDLAQPIVNTIYIELTPKARKLYHDMEKLMYMELEGQGITAVNAGVLTIKCSQIADGFSYTGIKLGTSFDDTQLKVANYLEIHDEKIKALESIIEEASGMPVLVVYNFKADLARLKKAFPKGKELGTDSKVMKEWNKGKVPILFVHPASAGHGLNLQDGSNIIAFFGIDWNLENHLQVIERIGPMRQLQSGHNRLVFVHYILARDTIDDLKLKRLTTKKSVQDILLEAVNKRKEIQQYDT